MYYLIWPLGEVLWLSNNGNTWTSGLNLFRWPPNKTQHCNRNINTKNNKRVNAGVLIVPCRFFSGNKKRTGDKRANGRATCVHSAVFSVGKSLFWNELQHHCENNKFLFVTWIVLYVILFPLELYKATFWGAILVCLQHNKRGFWSSAILAFGQRTSPYL